MERLTAPEAETAVEPAAAGVHDVSAADIAARLREATDLLHAQGANPYRIAAYRKAGETIAHLAPEEVVGLVDREGVEGLDRLPHVGRGIATAIVEISRKRFGKLLRFDG